MRLSWLTHQIRTVVNDDDKRKRCHHRATDKIVDGRLSRIMTQTLTLDRKDNDDGLINVRSSICVVRSVGLTTVTRFLMRWLSTWTAVIKLLDALDHVSMA